MFDVLCCIILQGRNDVIQLNSSSHRLIWNAKMFDLDISASICVCSTATYSQQYRSQAIQCSGSTSLRLDRTFCARDQPVSGYTNHSMLRTDPSQVKQTISCFQPTHFRLDRPFHVTHRRLVRSFHGQDQTVSQITRPFHA